MFSKLSLSSRDNPDWCGTWHKADVEKELVELGCKSDHDAQWLVWVLDHTIGSFNKEFTGPMEALVIDEHVLDITFKFSNGTVRIVKA